MPFTVGQVFEQARDQAPAFDKLSTPDQPLLRFLARWQRRLVQEVVGLYPAPLLTCYQDYALPFPDFVGGEAVPAAFYVEPGRLLLKGGGEDEFVLVEKDALAMPPRAYAGAIVGGRIYLARHEAWWAPVQEFRLYYVPFPEPLVNEASEFTVPDTAENAVVAGAAWFLATRQPAEVDVADFLATRDAEQAAWLLQLTSQRRANTGRIRRRR